jgi:hypothetical protein
MFNFFKNSNAAIQAAHDQMVSEGFIDTMFNDLQRFQRPIDPSVLLKIAEITMSVIPIGGFEAGLAKVAIKAFTKLAKKLAENVAEGKLTPNKDIKAQTAAAKQQLDDVVPTFQGAFSDQHTAIFSSAATGSGSDNEQFQWLSGGKQLGLTQSQLDLQTSMSNNLKAFFIANFIQAAGWVIDDQKDTGGFCLETNLPGDVTSNGRCQQIRVGCFVGGAIECFTDDPTNNPQSFNTNQVYGTIRPQVVIQNAVSFAFLFTLRSPCYFAVDSCRVMPLVFLQPEMLLTVTMASHRLNKT